MIVNYSGNRVGVLVDVQNVFYAARDQFSGKLDFQKLLIQCVGDRALIRSIAYCVTCPGTDPKGFHGSLKAHGFEIREKMLKPTPDGGAKGNWDVGITIDAINLAPSVDTVILVTGDGDFVDLVYYLRAVGKRVEAVCFHGAASNELLQSVDKYTWVDESMIIEKEEESNGTCVRRSNVNAGQAASHPGTSNS